MVFFIKWLQYTNSATKNSNVHRVKKNSFPDEIASAKTKKMVLKIIPKDDR